MIRQVEAVHESGRVFVQVIEGGQMRISINRGNGASNAKGEIIILNRHETVALMEALQLMQPRG